MKELAPSIFTKGLLAEGFFSAAIDETSIQHFFRFITTSLNLKTYGEPVIHETKSAGIAKNQGYNAFVPLIDSGIYWGLRTHQKFLSHIIYTCKDFEEHRAITKIKEFFGVAELEFKPF